MQRARFSILAGLVALFTVAACSENPNELELSKAVRATVVTPAATVDQSITTLLALFPKNLDNRDAESEGADLNPRATWDQIKKKYVTAQSKPAQMAIVKRKLLRLSDWIPLNAELMAALPSGEPKATVATRLVLYMSMYVYAGPSTATPTFSPAADVAVGIVTPTAPATIVTPTKHAGIQLEAGSVNEPTVIVVTQSPTVYKDNCSGPLDTKLCQYPQFYTFEAFPDKALNIPAKFNVCHVNEGTKRHVLTGVDHDRLRLAHTKPANPADYTDGSTIRDGIEILPLIHQDFSTCEASVYARNAEPRGAFGALSRLAKGIRNLVTPKSAYAIDVGLGGIGKSFSPFNDVDSVGRPDLTVAASFTPGPLHPGDQVVVTYTISNIGKATAAAVPAAIRLSTDATITPADPSLATISLSAMPPDSSFTVTDTLVVPQTATAGSYLGIAIQDDPTMPDANLANNQAIAPTAIDPSFVSVPNTLSVGATTACALTGSGVGYCWGREQPPAVRIAQSRGFVISIRSPDPRIGVVVRW